MPDEDVQGTTTISDDVEFLEAPTDEGPAEKGETAEVFGPQSDEQPEPEEPSDEAEDESEEEEDEPKVTYYDRPTVKQIKDKYPDFFKSFPQLRDMYFRESEFSKVFPTID